MQTEEERDDINDSPIEQVRLTVPITDDATLPELTFRTWVLGSITCILLAIFVQFISYRQNPIYISGYCCIMLLLPVGKLMAAKLPTKPIKIPGTKWAFSMNPGPFNIKEHVLISILATTGMDYPSSLTILTIVKAFYHKSINFWASFLLVQTSQMIGYGFAGIFMKFLVNSPYMWWPLSLLDVSLYRVLHEVEIRPKGYLTRLQFFIVVSVSSFAYYIIPNYFFPSISALSFVCWIWKDSVLAQQIGSGLHGLGIGSFALDWTTITSFLGSPLALPLYAIINQMVGFIIILYIITPIAYWTNSFNANRFPFYSDDLFDFNGQSYNVSRVSAEDLTFDEHAYNNYSKIYLSVSFVYAFGFRFGTATATLTHFVLFHGRETWLQIKKAFTGQNESGDVHNRLMKKYKSIPRWWFYIILVSMISLAILNCKVFGKQIQLPYWGVLLACFLSFILILPVGVITATTGQGLNMHLISQLIAGYVYPNKPLANMVFLSYGSSTLNHALSFINEFKLAHYMKIPPKSMFIAQIVGAFISYATNLGVAWWLLSTVENICDIDKLPKGSPWTCPFDHLGYSNTIIWGGVGPIRMFGPHGLYSQIYIFFLIGVLAPVLGWILSRLFPKKKWIRLINFPLILGASIAIPMAGAVHYWSWFTMGILFNVVVYRKYKAWWGRYNYVLSNGLDIGVAFMALLTSFALQMKDIYRLNWWGLGLDDHCPLATCPTAPGIKVDGCPVFH